MISSVQSDCSLCMACDFEYMLSVLCASYLIGKVCIWYTLHCVCSCERISLLEYE